jgi:antitoxin HicB
MRYAYPADVLEEPEGVTITFDGLSGATFGATREEALQRAPDLLASMLAALVWDNLPIPRPRPARGRPLIAVTALEAAKLALHEAMLAAGVTNAELAHRMGKDEKQIRRLRDPLHHSLIGQVEAALKLLGRVLVVESKAA